jgi:hypothetical protein
MMQARNMEGEVEPIMPAVNSKKSGSKMRIAVRLLIRLPMTPASPMAETDASVLTASANPSWELVMPALDMTCGMEPAQMPTSAPKAEKTSIRARRGVAKWRIRRFYFNPE